MTTLLLTLALLGQDGPPVAWEANDGPPVALASFRTPVRDRAPAAPLFAAEDCRCPHCPPDCDGTKGDCPRFAGKCCGACTCPAWSSTQPVGPMTPPAPATAPAPAPVPTHWTRTDSRGTVWTHADRTALDASVDAVERSYATPAPVAAPTYQVGSAGTCAGGSCGAPAAVATPRRAGWGLFRRWRAG